MCPQVGCMRGCIVTLVAFIWPFSTVSFQMCPQNTCIRGCKHTLVAICLTFLHCGYLHAPSKCLPAWMHSRIGYICLTFLRCGSPQTAPPKGSLFTLVAFVINPLTIKVIFAMINIHHFLQFDASSFATSVRPTINITTSCGCGCKCQDFSSSSASQRWSTI